MTTKSKSKKASKPFRMKPIAPMMIEHRLIERMISLMKQELEKINQQNLARPILIEIMVDFIRTYADRTHHGKEEDILFRDLAQKKISPEHKKIMDELIQEHIQARAIVSRLVSAKQKYEKGESNALPDIAQCLKELVEFYPKHIEKEDKRFFIPAMSYFTEKEQSQMLDECFEFDRKMIHEKYTKLIEKMEKEN